MKLFPPHGKDVTSWYDDYMSSVHSIGLNNEQTWLASCLLQYSMMGGYFSEPEFENEEEQTAFYENNFVPNPILYKDGCYTRMPEHPNCVYFLCGEVGEIIYIGQTADISKRISAHSLDKAFSFALIIPIPTPEKAKKLESDLIGYYQPPLNKMMVGERDPDDRYFVYLNHQKLMLKKNYKFGRLKTNG